MKASLKQRDYRDYSWKRAELILAIIQSVAVVVFLAIFFYRSLLAAIPLVIVGVMYFRRLKENKAKKCRLELVQQFKECILSVATSLRAGYAVENAFLESRKDMRLLYGEQSLIFQELELIRRGLVINITLEELLKDFAERSNTQEIQQFSEVFSIAKRNGGNLSEIIAASCQVISQRIEARQELHTLLSGREMEQKIMKAMPFAILFYIGVTYPGYFDMLYHNWQGMAIMTACLLIYLAAYVLSDRILGKIAVELSI